MLDIGIVGGGINGLCASWALAARGHRVTVYERDTLVGATSRASSKLLHGGLRYLESGGFRLVRESLRERDAWLRRAPHLAWPIRLTLPIYRTSRRPRWQVSLGLFAYDHLAGQSVLPGAEWVPADELMRRDPTLASHGLKGGYEFSDAQMDDYRLGLWVAAQARDHGVAIAERTEVQSIRTDGSVHLDGEIRRHDRILNIAGPWAQHLLERSGIASKVTLRLVRGSHLILSHPTERPYLLEVPHRRRIFFVLPWQGRTLVGTTEQEQGLAEPIRCSASEQEDLLSAYRRYFPETHPKVLDTFAGVRPLVRTETNVTSNSREYVLQEDRRVLTVFGGKWTTAMSLAATIVQRVER